MSKKYKSKYIKIEYVCGEEYNVINSNLTYDKITQKIYIKDNLEQNLSIVENNLIKGYDLCLMPDLTEKILIWHNIQLNWNKARALNTKKSSDGKTFNRKTKDNWRYLVMQGDIASKLGIPKQSFYLDEMKQFLQNPVILIIIVDEYIFNKIYQDIFFFELYPLLKKAICAYKKGEELIGYTEKELDCILKFILEEPQKVLNSYFNYYINAIENEKNVKDMLDSAYSFLENYYGKDFCKFQSKENFIDNGLETFLRIHYEKIMTGDITEINCISSIVMIIYESAGKYTEQYDKKYESIYHQINYISLNEKKI